MSVFVAWQQNLPVYSASSEEELEQLARRNFVSFSAVTEEEYAALVDGRIVIGALSVAEEEKKHAASLLREERDRRLEATDYMVMADYPLKEELRGEILQYRQRLRDLPEQAGFPWSGRKDDPSVPWPPLPSPVKLKGTGKEDSCV